MKRNMPENCVLQYYVNIIPLGNQRRQCHWIITEIYRVACDRNFDIKMRILLYANVTIFVLHIFCFYNHKRVNYTPGKTRNFEYI